MSASAPRLLIAVTGTPGQGKTRLLAELAAHQVSRGQTVEGFLAVGGERAAGNMGASEYRLRLLASGEELLWATRDLERKPPYQFHPEALPILEAWARALPRESPLVLLDEFSKLEAEGHGLMPLWPAIVAAAPQIVVIAVRDLHLEAIEAQLGLRFDLRIPATSADAFEQLEQACADYGEWTRIGLFGGAAGGIEVSVGAALHAAQIPLRGMVMSSVQASVMTFTGFGLAQPTRVVWVPFIAAGLKAFSPAGNRLRPMLAITAQGALYGASIAVAGWNALGITLGGAFVGAWAAAQGFILQYLLLGDELFKSYETIATWLNSHLRLVAPSLGWLVVGWTILHALVGGAVTFTAWRLRAPPRVLRDIIARESTLTTQPAVATAPKGGRWQRLGRDFLRWQFWLPLLFVGAIMLATGRSWSALAWLALRFVAVALVFIALLSLLRPARWAGVLRRRGWWGPAHALDGAFDRRQSHRNPQPPA